MKSIAFFDFDGTIIRKDSFPAFIIFSKGYVKFIIAAIWFVPYLILTKIFGGNPGIVKEKWFAYHFRGMPGSTLFDLGSQFAQHIITSDAVRAEMPGTIKLLQEEGVECVIVSASLDVWISSFSDTLKMNYISTEIEIKDNYFTGKFKSPNCNGVQKKLRIEKTYLLSEYNRIIVYGDSSGDLEMMSLATESHWI